MSKANKLPLAVRVASQIIEKHGLVEKMLTAPQKDFWGCIRKEEEFLNSSGNEEERTKGIVDSVEKMRPEMWGVISVHGVQAGTFPGDRAGRTSVFEASRFSGLSFSPAGSGRMILRALAKIVLYAEIHDQLKGWDELHRVWRRWRLMVATDVANNPRYFLSDVQEIRTGRKNPLVPTELMIKVGGELMLKE